MSWQTRRAGAECDTGSRCSLHFTGMQEDACGARASWWFVPNLSHFIITVIPNHTHPSLPIYIYSNSTRYIYPRVLYGARPGPPCSSDQCWHPPTLLQTETHLTTISPGTCAKSHCCLREMPSRLQGWSQVCEYVF